jgi:hypothetical protein
MASETSASCKYHDLDLFAHLVSDSCHQMMIMLIESIILIDTPTTTTSIDMLYYHEVC